MSKGQVLWVEGKDDQHIVWQLLKQKDVRESFDVKDKKGIDNIYRSLDFFPGALMPSETLGIILDADRGFDIQWQKIRTKLNQIGYKLPRLMPTIGLVQDRSDDLPRLGIWIMPNNLNDGMIEDFVLQLVESGDNLLPIVEETLTNIENNQINRYKLIHKSKAIIHTWLAWQEIPGRPMGSAINEVYFETNAPLTNQFVNWINKLFNPDIANQTETGA